MSERAPVSADTIVWQRVFWPSPLLEAHVLGLLRHWATEHHSPTVYLEARAESGSVVYLVGSQLRHARAVRRSIEQLVPDVTVSDHDDTRGTVVAARRLTVSTPRRALAR